MGDYPLWWLYYLRCFTPLLALLTRRIQDSPFDHKATPDKAVNVILRTKLKVLSIVHIIYDTVKFTRLLLVGFIIFFL